MKQSVVLFNPQQAHQAISAQLWPWVKSMTMAGHKLVAEVKVQEDDRTLQQNAFYWGACLRDISEQASIGGQRYTADAWHELFKRQFLGYRVKKVAVAGAKRKRITRQLRSTTLASEMEQAWRKAIKNGGSPDFILAGGKFIDAYRKEIVVTNTAEASRVKTLDAGVGSGVNTGLYFKGVEIIWDPQFEELDALLTPTVQWEKRCYFINSKHMKYRDDDMDIVTPVRPHDTLAMYAMVNLRLALSTSRRNAQAVLAIA